MARKIPQAFIDELMNRVDIVEIIDARVRLRKQGREFAGLCPFHEEKTPSFTVSPTKQFYHCFGCGAHGTAISFLMNYDHLSFVEAVQELAARAGLTLPTEAVEVAASTDHHQGLYHIMEQAALFFRRQLREHPEAEQAVTYLKKRGLTGQVAATYGIGYAPSGWDNLLKALGHNPEQVNLLLTAGLIIKKEGGGHYDRFRQRIMFPIRDRRGRVIAFGGRSLGEETPKYLNSPETPIFHKGRELYGLHEARQAVRNLERLLVVEGYMDVVALAQHGLTHAVATLGTATSSEHVERLFRTVPTVIFCFDGDRAGREAAWRALENCLPAMREGREARFMFLPEGEDPDSLVRQEGADKFRHRTENSVPLSVFFFESLRQKVDITSVDGRARLVELARPWLSKLTAGGVFHHLMVAQLAALVRMDQEALTKLLASPKKRTASAVPTAKLPRQGTPSLNNVQRAIALLLERPGLAAETNAQDSFAGLDIPGLPLLRAMLELLRHQPHLNMAAIMEQWRDSDLGRQLAWIAQYRPSVPEAGVTAEFQDILRWLRDSQKQQQTAQETQHLWNKRPKDMTAEEKAAVRNSLLTGSTTDGPQQ